MIDKAKIYIKSGRGGNGCISFFRGRFMPKGGPDGGSGGNGGSVYIQGSNAINTLLKFAYKKKFLAQDGGSGLSQNKKGKDGEDLIIQVPVGTQIHGSNGIFLEILDDKKILLIKGGKGGVGNASLAKSTMRTPRFSIPFTMGGELYLNMQLKIIGDVGLVGLPNAGKSSFINACTNSKSPIDEYKFTTLEPHLGVLNEKIILVDIPGIIEGASEGKGLGIKFLGHIERCKLLVMIIDINDDPLQTYEILEKELHASGIYKEIFIILNKCELLKKKPRYNVLNAFKEKIAVKVFLMSAKYKIGLKPIIKEIEKIYKAVNETHMEKEEISLLSE
jgi:GTP-binding protein